MDGQSDSNPADETEETAEAEEANGEASGFNRRNALKAGGLAAATVAGTWVVPVISGSGIAPAGAQAGSPTTDPPPSSTTTTTSSTTTTTQPTTTVDVTGQFGVRDHTYPSFSSNPGGCSDPAEWVGQTLGPQALNVPINPDGGTAQFSVTAKAPVGNIDDPCGVFGGTVATVTANLFTGYTPPASPTVIQNNVTGVTNCVVTLMDVQSCPPFGIANDNACWRVGAGGCSAALNGSASGAVTVRCTTTLSGSYVTTP